MIEILTAILNIVIGVTIGTLIGTEIAFRRMRRNAKKMLEYLRRDGETMEEVKRLVEEVVRHAIRVAKSELKSNLPKLEDYADAT